MPAPQVVREGSKKTVLVNFTETVKAMNREKEHVQLFFSVELGTECNLAPVNDSNDRLVIKGKYLPKHIETLLRKYLTEFVESPSLTGSFDTRLERCVALRQSCCCHRRSSRSGRDPATKLTSVVCNKTGSRSALTFILVLAATASHTHPGVSLRL
jgi:translation initiation factor 2 beta subunit (eIF-2beta)/eIF-5